MFFISTFVLLNAYADEGAQNYRQELGKKITVEEEYFPRELDAYARFMPLTGAKSQSGKVGLVTSASEYNYKIKAFGKIPVEFGVAAKYIGIDNTTAVKLPGRLTAFGLGLETTLPFFNLNKTYFTIGVTPSFFTDNWNFRSESFHLLQHYFMIYQPNQNLTLICGLDYAPGFKPPVSPIIGVIYKPTDRLTFNLIPANPEISYVLNDQWTVFAQGSYIGDEYKVTQNNLKDVVLNYNEIRAGAGIKYSLNKDIEGSLAAGSVFNRLIEYRQDSLGKVSLKPGFYSEFRLNIAI